MINGEIIVDRNGNIYYLSQDGDDETGKSFDEEDEEVYPFKTFQAIIDKAGEDNILSDHRIRYTID